MATSLSAETQKWLDQNQTSRSTKPIWALPAASKRALASLRMICCGSGGFCTGPPPSPGNLVICVRRRLRRSLTPAFADASPAFARHCVPRENRKPGAPLRRSTSDQLIATGRHLAVPDPPTRRPEDRQQSFLPCRRVDQSRTDAGRALPRLFRNSIRRLQSWIDRTRRAPRLLSTTFIVAKMAGQSKKR